MERILKRIFEYQRFSPNNRLKTMIEDVEKQYCALDDEELSLVAAAGDPGVTNDLLEKKYEYTDRNK